MVLVASWDRCGVFSFGDKSFRIRNKGMMSGYFRAQLGLVVVTFLALLWANYMVFMVVPNERVMGPIQRIFYFHVGSAFAAYFAIAAALIASLGYLATRSKKMDLLLEAAGEVGFVFCTIVLLSGMIWAKTAWNTYFNWEPRLVSFLLLWMIFLSFVILRHFGDPARVSQHSAILGIVGAVTVPIVVFSIDLLPQMAQLHPQVVSKQGLRDPSYYQALAIASFGLICLQFLLIWIRAQIGFLHRRV
ncbi:MAG: cytochrome C assembly protein [Proteobacteria bacterium]|nr:MAG: cytochrome C assembly protein [Pseudomonadota bacterium]